MAIGTVRTVTSERLVLVGTMLADRSRVALLTALLDGRAYTVTELARHVGVATATASEHLARLRDAALVTVEPSGRHRYYRLAGPEVAEMLESLGADPAAAPPRPHPAGLGLARSCYDHLAGAVAVAMYEDCVRAGYLTQEEGSALRLTTIGRTFFDDLGVKASVAHTDRPLARRCLDWTERRPHLGGLLGAGLLAWLLAHGWVVRGDRPRTIRLTRAGQHHLPSHFPGVFNGRL